MNSHKTIVNVPVQLSAQQDEDIRRFFVTCEDNQNYDVPRQRMQSLARLGLIRSTGGGRYEFTPVGSATVEALRALPSRPHVVEELQSAEWPDAPIVNQTTIQAAFEELGAANQAEAARQVPIRSGDGAVTKKIAESKPLKVSLCC